MTAPSTGNGQSLAEFLTARARQSTDVRLALNAAAGVVALILALIARPLFWVPLAALGTSFLAYGAWGILDRELATGVPGRHRALTVARGAAAALGALAGVAFILTFFFQFVGTWIS